MRFHEHESSTESYWHSLEEGKSTYGGSVRPNPRESAWHARNHPPVRAVIEQLEPSLDDFHHGRLIRNMGIASQLVGSQSLRVEKLLNSAVTASETNRRSPYHVRRLASELRDQLTGDTYHWRFIAPLEGISLRPGTRAGLLGTGFRLRELPLWERELLINADHVTLAKGSRDCIIRSRVALEHTVNLSSDRELGVDQFLELEAQSRLTATILSTMGAHDVRVAGYFTSPALAYPLTVPFYGAPEMPIYESLKQATNFDRPSIARLRVLVESAQSGPNARRTDIALSRLFEVMRHREPGDRLIDAWIALESLFLSDANSELSFRAALRIAAFTDTSDSRALYDFVKKKSYKMRSQLVHGDTPGEGELKEVADRTVNIARASVLSILGLQVPFKPSEIERALL